MKRIVVALVVLVVVGATWWIVGLAEDVTVPSFEAPPVPVAVVPRVDVAPVRVVEQVVVDAGAVATARSCMRPRLPGVPSGAVGTCRRGASK